MLYIQHQLTGSCAHLVTQGPMQMEAVILGSSQQWKRTLGGLTLEMKHSSTEGIETTSNLCHKGESHYGHFDSLYHRC
jgi:hypothetical protein